MLRKMNRARSGMAILPIVIGIAAVGIVIYPILRWYFSMVQGTAGLGDKLEMQMITQEYLARINAATYDEIVQTAAAKGSSWTEDVGNGKYEVKYEIGADGKFTNAKCDTEATIGDGDKHCRTATITLTSKNDPTQVMNLSTITVSGASRISEIQRRLSVQDDRFNEYYTKGDGDGHYACPWDYRLVSDKCVPCLFPNFKQFRNGNCSLYTCPTGQKANAAGNGCEAITCSGHTYLSGDFCRSCSMGWKDYYIAASGCAAASCPTGQKANSAHTGCETITCPSGKSLMGDDCVQKCFKVSSTYDSSKQTDQITVTEYDSTTYKVTFEGRGYIQSIRVPKSIYHNADSDRRIYVKVPTRLAFLEGTPDSLHLYSPCSRLYYEPTNETIAGSGYTTSYKVYFSCPAYAPLPTWVPFSLTTVAYGEFCYGE